MKTSKPLSTWRIKRRPKFSLAPQCRLINILYQALEEISISIRAAPTPLRVPLEVS